MSASVRSTAVSAPGKVLLAGGYLVLDQEYTALVFGLSARIHVVVQDAEEQSGSELPQIVVQSPQFKEAEWTYSYGFTELGGVKITQLQGDSATPIFQNPFLETTLSYALAYISATISTPIKPISISIFADNDYYSQPSHHAILSSASASTSTVPFRNFDVRLQGAHKTGLGSSAALVTALAGALLSHYLPGPKSEFSSIAARTKLHNLAQASHCAAQGKIGSGFDIATAVYGSCVYRRFSPSILAHLGAAASPRFATHVRELVDGTSPNPDHTWDCEIAKGGVAIPHGMALVMLDVDCGSQTVGMVKGVLEWRKRDPRGAKMLWDSLQEENAKLATNLVEGGKGEIVESVRAIRGLIREMSTRSGVPIEPPEQTALIDAVVGGVEGVYEGVVPGAGGYDAIVLIVKDDKATLDEIGDFVAGWGKLNGSNVKLLDVRGEMEGVKEEKDGSLYEAWI